MAGGVREGTGAISSVPVRLAVDAEGYAFSSDFSSSSSSSSSNSVNRPVEPRRLEVLAQNGGSGSHQGNHAAVAGPDSSRSSNRWLDPEIQTVAAAAAQVEGWGGETAESPTKIQVSGGQQAMSAVWLTEDLLP